MMMMMNSDENDDDDDKKNCNDDDYGEEKDDRSSITPANDYTNKSVDMANIIGQEKEGQQWEENEEKYDEYATNVDPISIEVALTNDH